MLKVDEIQNGVVIDHITAGTGLALYHMMELERLNNASVALFAECPQPKGRKKDIIKIEGDVSKMSFDVLAYVDPKISITFIRDGRVTEKKTPRAAQAPGQRHQMHEPALHYFHRGGLRPYFCTDAERPLPLHLLRAGVPRQTVK